MGRVSGLSKNPTPGASLLPPLAVNPLFSVGFNLQRPFSGRLFQEPRGPSPQNPADAAFPRNCRRRVFCVAGDNPARERQFRAGSEELLFSAMRGGEKMDAAIRMGRRDCSLPDRRSAAAPSPVGQDSELLKNCINSDKFTTFFDKLMKGIFPVNDCNIAGYAINMNAPDSSLRQKKVFRRLGISPQLPAFARGAHRAAA